MKKLVLNVGDLRVDSFSPVPDKLGPRGTVQGRSYETYYQSCDTWCCSESYWICPPTEYLSCVSCPGTCALRTNCVGGTCFNYTCVSTCENTCENETCTCDPWAC